MTAILFLLAAFVIAAIGIGIVLLANREPSRSSLTSIDDFARQKRAMAPRSTPESRRNPKGPGSPGIGTGRGV